MMSVELLKLTSAALPSSAKPVPRICKPAASISPIKKFDDSIFSPLPVNKTVEETSADSHIDSFVQEPVPQQISLSPITVKASDNFALFGTPASSPMGTIHEDVSIEDQSSVQSILSPNTSTPDSIRVKILSSKLKEIPSPHSQLNENNSSNGTTPPRALGIPISKRNYESHSGLHLKPDSRTKPVKKVLSQGIMKMGPATSLTSADESSPDDSIVVVNANDTEYTTVKDKLYQKKGTNLSKQGIVVYPNVIQYKEEKTFLRSEAKGVRTETVSVKFDEGTQCEEEKVVTHARGVQTSPAGSSSEFGNPVKKQCPLQNQHPLQCLASTATTTLMHTTTSQLSSSDTVMLIASTAAAAAIAASASLHNNTTKHSKDPCLGARNDSLSLQQHLRETSTNIRRTSTAVHTATQTVGLDHTNSETTDQPSVTKGSSQPSHFCSSVDNSQIDKKTRIIFDQRSEEKDFHRAQRSKLLKQKYEKTSVGGVIEVLHHVSMAEEEIEHQCAALECTSTLTDFTEAMIEGRPIQERIRIHQTINKLIEQTKAEDSLLASGTKPTASGKHQISTEVERGKSQLTRQSAKSNQQVTKSGKRKTNHQVKSYSSHIYGEKLNYGTSALKRVPKAECGILMNTLWSGDDSQLNSAKPRVAAVSLGPPRQSQSHHISVPTTTLAPSVGIAYKSVGCQAPSNGVTPIVVAGTDEEFSKKKPDTSTRSIKPLSPALEISSPSVIEATVLSHGKPSSTASTMEHDDTYHGSNFQQVLDICSDSTTNNSDVSVGTKRGEQSITVQVEEAKSTVDYQGPSFPPKPAERLPAAYNIEPLTMSASELDKRLKENLEQKAMEWIHQELLVRLATERRQDPVGHTTNSCSTCSPTAKEHLAGMHNIPADEEDECIKSLVCEEVLDLIKRVLKGKRENEYLKESEATEMNGASSSVSELCHLLTPTITPPPTPTSIHSTTSSLDHVKLVATPLPTPPQSPTGLQQPPMVESSMEFESIRIPTPKSSLSSSSIDDIGSLVHDTRQPETVVSSNLSTPTTTQQTISTSIHTPQASTESTTKKPSMEEPVTRPTTDPTTSSTESCSTSSSSPAVSDVTSTEHEISMGEYILAKPAVVQRTKKPDYSLSEGEVLLSPGDARWGALRASKLRGNLTEKKKKDMTRSRHPVVEAFLDLKQAMSCEKDSDSATEFSVDSLQFKPQMSLSNGEIRDGSHDPFKKLLDKLNSSSSSSDSTGVVQDEDKDNTLSEVTSFAIQEDVTSMISLPPLPTAGDVTSPGELVRNITVLAAPPEDELSLGEVHHTKAVEKTSRSPGEIPPILRASETRNGIDVIRISKWSDKLPKGQTLAAVTSESQYLMEPFNSSEVTETSSQTLTNAQGNSNNSSRHLPVASLTNFNDGPTESHTQSITSSPTTSDVFEGDTNRKMVTINMPNTTNGFHSEEDTSSKEEHSTEITFTTSEMTSENF